MRITTNNIDFELPADFACELTRNNVLLTDAGEQTAPITLPGTPHNLRLVANSDRTDNYYKPLTDLDVVVSDGLFNRPCNLGIHTANEVDGISCTIYLGTGDFYSKVGDMKLASLNWPIYKSPTFNSQTLAQRVQYLIDILKEQYGTTFNSNEIFRIAPVATTQTFTYQVMNYDNYYPNNKLKDEERTFILNGFERFHRLTDFSGTGSDILNTFEGEFTQKQKNDKAYVDISLGYGMTPFLKLRYVVSFIFTSFGYTFDSRQLTELVHEYEEDIVVLNNVADAIYAGILNFSQLVPNTTIKVFILEIEKLFAGKFKFDEVTKEVFFYNSEYIFGAAIPDQDISEYICNKIIAGSTEFKLIKLIENGDSKSTADESKIPTETIDFDFIKEVTILAGVNDSDFTNATLNIELKMVTIDSVVHANTALVVNNVVIKGTEKTSSAIQLANIKPLLESAVNDGGVRLDYYRSYRLFEGISTSSFLAVCPNYIAYQAFRLNSNIPLEAEMDIPAPILEKMNLQMPKILNGQKVMIESITQTLGKKGTQKVKFRTLREYKERS